MNGINDEKINRFDVLLQMNNLVGMQQVIVHPLFGKRRRVLYDLQLI